MAFMKGAATGKGKGKGRWAFIPAAPAHFGGFGGWGKGSGKGKGGKGGKASVQSSKFMDKLAKIDASRKVWVGGLSKKTTWKELEKHFKDTVKPSVTEVMKNGRACLAFKTEEEAQSAISAMNGTELDGKSIEVDVWTQKEKTEKVEGDERRKDKKTKSVIKSSSFTNKQGKKSRADPKLTEKLKDIDASLKVWVGGLAAETTAGRLRKHFVDAGCKPHLTNLTGKDAACLSFKTDDEAQSAISALSGTTLDDIAIEVDVWTKPEKKENQ